MSGCQALADRVVGTVETLDFSVRADEMRAFAALSGDDNPIHADAAFAAERGFRGPVVFGGLLVAVISRLLGTRLPGPGCLWHSLALNFRSPLHVGEAATLTGTVTYVNADLGVLRLDLRIAAGGRTIAEGKAQASLPPVRP